MSSVIPDWMKEQQRVDALLGKQAQGYGSGTPASQGGGFQYGPLGVDEPHLDPSSGLMVGDNSRYGYFDPQNAQGNVDYSQAMLDALHRGDNAAYEKALGDYRANSGGLQPIWSYNKTSADITANARNPGGVNAGANPMATEQPPAWNVIASGLYRDANGDLKGGTPPPAQSATPAGGRVNQIGAQAPGGAPMYGAGGPSGSATSGQRQPSGGLPGTMPRGPGRATAQSYSDAANATAYGGASRTLPRAGGLSVATPPGRAQQLGAPSAGGRVNAVMDPTASRVRPSGISGAGTNAPPDETAPIGTGVATPPGRTQPIGTPAPPSGSAPPYNGPPAGGGRTNAPPYVPPEATGPRINRPIPPSDTTPPDTSHPQVPRQPSTPGSPYVPPGSATPPYPSPSYTGAAFPSWSTWNDGQPYYGGDPGMMATSESNRATDYGNLFANEFGQSYADANASAGAYGDAADTAYSDLYKNPGYTGDESSMIQNGGIDGGLNSLRASGSELDANYLTPQERSAIEGNPNSIYDAFDPNTLNDLAKTGTGATQSFFGKNYQSAKDALASGAGRSDAAVSQYGANARGDLATMRSDLYGAIDPNKLGIGDAEVDRLKEQAGRQVGFQYGAAMDELQRKAEAAGNVSPLALSAARDRLLRSQSVDSANAVTNADLSARQKQRDAEQDISTRRLGVGTTIGNAGIGLEGDIASTGLNANQNMTALNAGTEATYGTLGTNLGLNTTKQLTDTANTAGQTKIGQAQAVDMNKSTRATTLGTNRQGISLGNLNTKYSQGMGTAAANSGNATTVGNARIAGSQAARNYWAGQSQFQGGQANAAAGQQISGAQTSLSGQGQGGSTAVGNLNARRNPIRIGDIGFTL